MVKIAHIEKFVKDNPGRFAEGRAEKVLEHARFFGRDPITSLNAEEVLGSDASAFLKLLDTNVEYIQISVKR